MHQIIAQIASEIKVKPDQVKTAVELLDGGATVPFIARYRKEATGGLDDIQLRELEFRLSYLRELADRRIAPPGALKPCSSALLMKLISTCPSGPG